MSKIVVRAREDDVLRAQLAQHPFVTLDNHRSDHIVDFWHESGWHRRIVDQPEEAAPFGLMELMDNNPLVCADSVRVPNPSGTLALVALGPIFRAGIVTESPTIIASFPVFDDEVTEALTTVGWFDGAAITSGDVDLGTVRGLNAIAAIRTPAKLSDLDDIYEEAYGRSFFVWRDEQSDWVPRLAEGQPNALYRLRITPGDPVSLLTIQTFADINHKLGAGQVIHTMNVMAGFEESLGVA